MAKIIVYPTKENALRLIHPDDGAVKLSGSAWEQDGFTCRMITDGDLTVDPNGAWRAPAPVAAKVEMVAAAAAKASK